MPTHFKWKLNSSKKKGKALNLKSKRTVKSIPWNDNITDLSIYSSTPEEIKQRRLAHKSNNLEIAKMELLERRISKHKVIDNLETDQKTGVKPCDEKKFASIPVVTLAPKNAEVESTVCNTINEDYKTIVYSNSRRITDEPVELQGIKTKADNMRNFQESSSNVAEVKEVLLQLQRKLHVTDENEEDVPVLLSKAENRVSSFTSLFLNTLDKLSHKCIKTCEELAAEKRKTKELQGAVKKLKHKVDTLAQDMISLQMIISENNSTQEIHNSHAQQKSKTLQLQVESVAISKEDRSPSNCNSVDHIDKTQCSLHLQTPPNLFRCDVSKLSDNSMCSSSGYNSSYSCSTNAHLYDASFNSDVQQSLGTAIMLRPPVQLDMNRRHCSTLE